MAATPPPSITPAPTPAPQRGEKATFSTRVDAFVVWLTAAVGQFAALAMNVYNNALDAFSSASAASSSASAASASAANALSSANSASATAGATLWIAGQTVNQDQVKISPFDRRTYRRKTATGVSNVDPAMDAVNYVLISADASSYILLASADVGSPVVNIDFLNLFSDVYLKYVIEVVSVTQASAASSLNFQAAVSGSVDNTTSYFIGSNGSSSISVGVNDFPTATLVFSGPRTGDPSKDIAVRANTVTWRNSAKASGFRLFSQNSQITGGSVRVYGIRK